MVLPQHHFRPVTLAVSAEPPPQPASAARCEPAGPACRCSAIIGNIAMTLSAQPAVSIAESTAQSAEVCLVQHQTAFVVGEPNDRLLLCLPLLSVSYLFMSRP